MERAGRAAQFRFCWSWCGRESKTRPMPKALPGPQHVDEQPSIRVAPVFHLVSFFWAGPGRLRHWVRVLGWWQELPGPRSLQLPLFRIMSHEYICDMQDSPKHPEQTYASFYLQVQILWLPASANEMPFLRRVVVESEDFLATADTWLLSKYDLESFGGSLRNKIAARTLIRKPRNIPQLRKVC